MNLSFQKISVLIALIAFTWSCSPTKNLQTGKVYLKANKIDIPGTVIDPNSLLPYIKQPENKRELWVFKLKMQMYLMLNDSNLARRNEKKKVRLAKKNEKRIIREKDSIEYSPVALSRLKSNSEPPVIFDASLVEATSKQFHKALFNKGYFTNKIIPQYHYSSDSTTVKVIYTAKEGVQYKLNKVSLVVNDANLVPAIKDANKFSELHRGDPYDTKKIDEERERFTSKMRDQGYYFFTKEFIVYEVDSTVGDQRVNLRILIKNPKETAASKKDSLIIPKHEKYRIGTVTINTSYNSNYTDSTSDSIHFNDLVFINLSRLQHNPFMFSNKLYFKTNDYYSEFNQAQTYTRLSGLNNFKYINIAYSLDDQDSNVLDCAIKMTPFKVQSVGIEAEGTNSQGNLGVSGYLSYMHRNVFGNAEQFKVRLKGGMEVQPTNSSDDNSSEKIIPFNTIEYGVESSIIFQDLVMPRNLRKKIMQSFNQPKTSVNFTLNYQLRPDFERFLTNASMGYSFSSKKKNTKDFFIYPLDISYIIIDKTDDFIKRLEEQNNPLLNATYSDQFIVGTRMIQTWSNQKKVTQKNHMYNRVQFESAGNGLNALNKIFNAEKDTLSGDEFYTFGQVRYAQFIKVQNDYRYYSRINKKQSFAYRLLGGIGVPYGNAQTLPYDRSFYGGGANDNRGWRARSLGPGSMIDSLKAGIDQVADIKIQVSVEYRFNIVKSIDGAIFADGGNIWLLRKDEARPGADFDLTRFYKELALSAGAGVRLNFGFLLVRFDWGLKLFDPALPAGQKFVLNRGDYLNNYQEYSSGRSYNYSVFNLGIGYPF